MNYFEQGRILSDKIPGEVSTGKVKLRLSRSAVEKGGFIAGEVWALAGERRMKDALNMLQRLPPFMSLEPGDPVSCRYCRMIRCAQLGNCHVGLRNYKTALGYAQQADRLMEGYEVEFACHPKMLEARILAIVGRNDEAEAMIICDRRIGGQILDPKTKFLRKRLEANVMEQVRKTPGAELKDYNPTKIGAI